MVDIFDEVIVGVCFVNTYLNKIKKVEFLPPFLPQIYHKLNLLMLWLCKGMADIFLKETYQTKGKYIRLKACMIYFVICLDVIQ